MDRLRTKLNERFGAKLEPLLAVGTASRGTKGSAIWIAAGAALGIFARFALNLSSDAIAVGTGCGLGYIVWMAVEQPKARADTSQPGGLFVALGITATSLIVFERPLWGGSRWTIAGQTLLSDIASTTTEKGSRLGFGQRPVKFHLRSGSNWRYEIARWSEFAEAMPEHLRG